MKKIIAVIVLALALSLMMAACATNGKDNSKTPENTTPLVNTDLPDGTKTEDPVKIPESGGHVHSYGEWSVVSDATCEKEGTKERECSCGEKERAAVQIADHKFVNGVCTMCKKNEETKFVPDYKPGQENKVGSDMSTGTYCSQGNWIYFASSTYQISKITKYGTNNTVVYETTQGYILNINTVGDWIYFYCQGNTEGKSYIAKVRTDGTGFKKLLSGVQIWDMLVVKDKIYYTVSNSEYKDYAKECMPLYCISVNGGATKMIHDGAVSSLASDGTYLYFLYTTKSNSTSICRVKADGTNKASLMTFNKGEDTSFFTLGGSKIYFLKHDKYSEECTIASISANGGSYTTYGKIPYYSDFLYAVGSKLYYYGSAYSAGGYPGEECGLIEYDTATKRYKLIKEDYEIGVYYFTDGMIISEGFTGEALTKLTVYTPNNGATLNFKIK